jgi:hypothetical protein
MIPLPGVLLLLAPLDDHAEFARGWTVQRQDVRIPVAVRTDVRIPVGSRIRVDGLGARNPYAAIGVGIRAHVRTYEAALARLVGRCR